MAQVILRGVVKRFGRVTAVNNLDLEVDSGEFVTLLGPSGCGKTTALRCIAGLEEIDAGEIYIGEQMVSGPRTFVPPEKRAIGMIFQSYAVWPHMTVFDNVAYGLKIKGVSRDEIKRRVTEVLRLVGLSGLENRYATDLSGGQQQRVAVARSVVMRPEVLLFDEPLSNLDARLRERMRFELRALQKSLGMTFVYVTHDQAEAMAMSDRIVLIKDGEIVQSGTPEMLYNRPADSFVAEFIGLTNFIEAKTVSLSQDGSMATVKTEDDVTIRCFLPEGVAEGEKVLLAIRPEHIEISATCLEGHNCWESRIKDAVFLGDIVDGYVEVGNTLIRIQVRPDLYDLLKTKDRLCYLKVDPAKIIYIPARTGQRPKSSAPSTE